MVAEHKIENFISKVNLGVEWFQDAGKLLVDMLDENPGVKDDIIGYRKGWITMDVLNTFEMIGRKQLAVEAMFLPRHVLNHLIELPIGQQVSIATKMLPVVTGYRNGGAHKTDKPARDLTRREAARVIGPQGVRPVEQQAAMLATTRKFKSCGLFDIFTDKNGEIKMTNSIRKNRTAICQRVRLTDGVAEIELVCAVQPNAKLTDGGCVK
jgi:hypothetical protein